MKLEHAFLQDPALRRVLAALEAAGGEVRVVGGAVRDAVMGRPIGDIDLACTLEPELATRAAEAASLKVVPTGLKHGTVTVIADHRPFEVTTLRRDVATDGRHADVAFTTDWQEDAARRDFTMNALSCAADGTVTDFFTGLEDIRAGRVRFVGNPLLRIREDILRILRFFRFHAHFGTGAPDPAGYTACGMLAPLLPSLSRERVRAELLKLLQAADPAPVWHLMQECGAVDALQLPLHNIARLEQMVGVENHLFSQRHSGEGRNPSPDSATGSAAGSWTPACAGVTGGDDFALRRLFALSDPGADTGELADQLRLSNAEGERLRAMAQPMILPADQPALLRQAYWHGAAVIADHLVLAGRATPALLEALAVFRRPVFPLTGNDLIQQGMPPGPRMGELLRRIEEWWVEQNFVPDKAGCLEHLKTLQVI